MLASPGEIGDVVCNRGVGSQLAMISLMTESTITTDRAWGGQTMVAPLKRVLVRKPAPPAAAEHFANFGYPRAVNHDRAQSEHDAFRALLAASGAEVVVAGPDEAGLLDAIFAYDPSLMTDAGAVLLRPGKELRMAEVDLAEATRSCGSRSSDTSRHRARSRAATPSGSTSRRSSPATVTAPTGAASPSWPD